MKVVVEDQEHAEGVSFRCQKSQRHTSGKSENPFQKVELISIIHFRSAADVDEMNSASTPLYFLRLSFQRDTESNLHVARTYPFTRGAAKYAHIAPSLHLPA